MRKRWIFPCALLAMVAPVPTAAQSRDVLYPNPEDPRVAADSVPPTPEALHWRSSIRAEAEEGRPVPALAAAGLVGGAVGAVAGGYLAALLASGDHGDDLDFLSGMVAGAAIGEGLLLPLGVHLANRRAGSYPTSALVSLGLTAAGLLALEAVHYDPPGAPVVLVAIPLAQIATSIAIESATE